MRWVVNRKFIFFKNFKAKVKTQKVLSFLWLGISRNFVNLVLADANHWYLLEITTEISLVGKKIDCFFASLRCPLPLMSSPVSRYTFYKVVTAAYLRILHNQCNWKRACNGWHWIGVRSADSATPLNAYLTNAHESWLWAHDDHTTTGMPCRLNCYLDCFAYTWFPGRSPFPQSQPVCKLKLKQIVGEWNLSFGRVLGDRHLH
jgi:hypothetical protein